MSGTPIWQDQAALNEYFAPTQLRAVYVPFRDLRVPYGSANPGLLRHLLTGTLLHRWIARCNGV